MDKELRLVCGRDYKESTCTVCTFQETGYGSVECPKKSIKKAKYPERLPEPVPALQRGRAGGDQPYLGCGQGWRLEWEYQGCGRLSLLAAGTGFK